MCVFTCAFYIVFKIVFHVTGAQHTQTKHFSDKKKHVDLYSGFSKYTDESLHQVLIINYML